MELLAGCLVHGNQFVGVGERRRRSWDINDDDNQVVRRRTIEALMGIGVVEGKELPQCVEMAAPIERDA